MFNCLRLLEIAGGASLISATVIAFMYVKLEAAKRKRQLASKFKQALVASDNPGKAAVNSLAILYGVPRRKKKRRPKQVSAIDRLLDKLGA